MHYLLSQDVAEKQQASLICKIRVPHFLEMVMHGEYGYGQIKRQEKKARDTHKNTLLRPW